MRISGDPNLHEVELGAAALWPGRRPYVVVHPGASVPARTVSPRRWHDVVATLADAGRNVVVTGSEQESRLTTAVVGQTQDVLDLAGRTATLRGLGRVIADATVFVGGCTGPLHLAAAVATPTVAVFPPTVALREPAALAAAVDRLLASPSLRHRMGVEGAALVRARYTWQQVARSTLDIYAGLAKAREWWAVSA